MPLVTWDARYSVNVREIDRQHQKLFGLLNELHDAMMQGRGRNVIGKVLAELVDYTVYHFETEERLFREHGYGEAEQHKAEHVALTDTAAGLKTRFDKNEAEVTRDVLKFLQDWLYNHIMGSDKRFGPFLNAKGVS